MPTTSKKLKRDRTRVKLAEGIYRGPNDILIVARAGSVKTGLRTKTHYHDLTDAAGVPYSRLNRNLTELVAIRVALMEQLDQADAATRTAGTLAADCDRFLRRLPDGTAKKKEFAPLLHHWKESPLGERPRQEIRRADINQQLETWRTQADPYAHVTLNHHTRALRQLYIALHDGDPDAPLITDKGIKHYKPKRAGGRGVPLPIIARLLSHIPDIGRAKKGDKRPPYSELKIRLRVIAWSGLPHMQVQRLKKPNFSPIAGILHVEERIKGQGAPAVDLELIEPAIAALKDFDAAGLWGKSWSRSSMNKSWKTAIKNCRAALEHAAAIEQAAGIVKGADTAMLEQFNRLVKPNCHPYDLRHSYLTDLYQETGDPIAVAAHAQHADLETTKQYTTAGIPVRLAAAVEKMRERWARMPAPPPVVRGAKVRPFPVLVTQPKEA